MNRIWMGFKPKGVSCAEPQIKVKVFGDAGALGWQSAAGSVRKQA